MNESPHHHIRRPHPWLARVLVAVPTLALVGSFAFRSAHGAPSAQPTTPSSAIVQPVSLAAAELRNVEVEVIDTSKDKTTETARITIAVADGGKTGNVGVPIGPLWYTLSVASEGAQAGSVGMVIKLRRSDNRPGSPANISVDVASPMKPGPRTVVSSIARPDGTKTEVAVRLR